MKVYVKKKSHDRSCLSRMVRNHCEVDVRNYLLIAITIVKDCTVTLSTRRSIN